MGESANLPTLQKEVGCGNRRTEFRGGPTGCHELDREGSVEPELSPVLGADGRSR